MKNPLVHLVIVSIVCAIALIGYGVSYAMVAAKSASVASLQNKIDAETETINHANTTQTALDQITGDEAAIQGYFVPETGIVAFIDYLQSLGGQLGTSVDVLSVAAVSATTQPTLALSLTITGTFDGVMRTVGAVEYAPYDISISTLSVGETTKSSWHADLTLSVGSKAAGTATSTP